MFRSFGLFLFYKQCLKKLLQKEEVQMPLFNFQKGKREWRKEPLCLEDNQILIIEGIHGLNPK